MDTSTGITSILAEGQIHRVFDVLPADESASVTFPEVAAAILGYGTGRIARVGITVIWTTGAREVNLHDHETLEDAQACYATNLAEWQAVDTGALDSVLGLMAALTQP